MRNAAQLLVAVCGLVAGTLPADAEGAVMLKCTAFGGSHTIRMTFDFDPARCRLYWHEVERVLPLEVCSPERVVAVKPFSPTVESRLHFYFPSGRFVDQYGIVEDRGRCEAVPLSGGSGQ